LRVLDVEKELASFSHDFKANSDELKEKTMRKLLQSKHSWIKAAAVVPLLAVGLAGCNDANQQTAATDIPPATVGVDSAGAPPSVSDPGKDVRGYVRAVHLVPGAPVVALMRGEQKIIDGVGFGEVSEFVGLGDEKTDIHAEGKHQFSIAGPDGKTLAGPIEVDVEKGEDITLMITGSKEKVIITPYDSTSKPTMDKARLAILYSPQLGPKDGKGPLISVMMDDKTVPNTMDAGDDDVEYQDVEPGSHTVKVMSDKTAAVTKTLDLEKGKSYTMIVYKDAAGKAQAKVLEEKFRPALINAPTVTTEPATP
jgi:hypothetical protein